MSSSPPDWLNAHGDATPVIDPESHVREYAERRGRDPNENCPALVIGGFINLMVEPLAEAVGAAESDVRLGLQGPKTINVRKAPPRRPEWLRPGLRIGELDGHPIGVARIPVGSARSVMTLEELMALGARTFLIAGATGALQQGIGVGDYVIATSGLREEGASYHYRRRRRLADPADGPTDRPPVRSWRPLGPVSTRHTPAASGVPTRRIASSAARSGDRRPTVGTACWVWTWRPRPS